MSYYRHVLVLVVSQLAWLPRADGALQAPAFSPAGGAIRSPALVTITNPNPAGAILYTMDAGDPRDYFGNVVTNARRYSEALSLNRSMVIRARVKSGTNWSDLAAAAFTADQDFSKLLFTEVMYHPRDEDDVHEFVELKNIGSVALDLSGLQFAAVLTFAGDPATFNFPPGFMAPAGGFVVLVANVSAFQSIHPGIAHDARYEGEMANSESHLRIQGTNGAAASGMFYSSHAPWQVVPDNHGYFPEDGVGFSLVRVNLDPAADPGHPSTWRASAYRFGSPGQDDPAPVVPPIFVNEVLARSGMGLPDTVELFNPNATNVHIGGWRLSDERNEPMRRYMFPLGTMIPAGGFLTVNDTLFGVGPNGFGLSGEADRCYLFSGDTNGVLTGWSHGLEFLGSDRDVTFGRYVSSDGTESFPQQLTRTLGGTNSGPRLPPVVISEVMYQPPNGGAEYVELRNTTSEEFAMWDPQDLALTWALYPFSETIPVNTVIPPHGHLLFVQGDPELFRAEHGVPFDVPIVSFFANQPRQDSGDTIRLHRPSGTGGPGVARYVEVDRMDYLDRSPWTAAAAGSGHSLERLDLAGIANDSANWRACPEVASPGRANAMNLPPLPWAGEDRTAFPNRLITVAGEISDDRWPGTTLAAWWDQVEGPAAAQLASNDLAAAIATFPLAGSYTLRLTATDGVFTRTDEATFQVMERPFDGWRHSHFTPVELGNPAISGPGSDPDGDGWTNLEEYFFATEPRAAELGTCFRSEIVNEFLQVSWTQRNGTVDVMMAMECADDLQGPWFGGPGLFVVSETVRPNNLREVSVRDLVPTAGNPRRFVRIRLELVE